MREEWSVISVSVNYKYMCRQVWISWLSVSLKAWEWGMGDGGSYWIIVYAHSCENKLTCTQICLCLHTHADGMYLYILLYISVREILFMHFYFFITLVQTQTQNALL